MYREVIHLRGLVVTKQKIEPREVGAAMTQFAVLDCITMLPKDDEEDEGHTNWENLLRSTPRVVGQYILESRRAKAHGQTAVVASNSPPP